MIRNNIRMKVLIVILLLFILSPTTEAIGTPEKKKIVVVMRFDDYSSRSSTDIEVKIIDAFQKKNIPCTFGVIPYVCARDIHDPNKQDVITLTPVKANILNNAVKAGILDVALHGYSHQTIRKKGGNTEFSGLDYGSQVERIAMGKNLLESILDTQVTTFIPPWNSYDLNTIRALEKLKFSCISAGTGKSSYGFESSLLKFLPTMCDLLQLRDAVKYARLVPEVQPVIIVLFHEFDFLEIDTKRGRLTYEEFVELLDWLSSQKDVHVVSVEQATKMIGDLSAGRFMDYKSCRKLPSFVPPFLSKLYALPVGVYLSPSAISNLRLKNMKNRLLMFTLVFYLATLLASVAAAFFAGLIVFPRWGLLKSIFKYGLPILLILLSVYALRDFKLGYRGSIIVVVGLGAYIGVLNCLLKLRKEDRLKGVI